MVAMTSAQQVVLSRDALQALLDHLKEWGYRVLGPTVRDQAIVYDDIDAVGDLPEGWTDSQDGGRYRLEKRDDAALFGYALGPKSWKAFLHQPAIRLWRAKREGDDISVTAEPDPETQYRVGGFYRVPRKRELRELAESLKWAREAAIETIDWLAGFDFPDRNRDYTFVALQGAGEYPFNEGRIASNRGLDIAPRDYDAHFEESHLPRTTALRSLLRGGGAYLCGPLARYNLNFSRLSPLAQEKATAAGLGPTCTNPYRSIIVRAVEVLYACDEALRLIEGYEEPEQPAVPVYPRAGVGFAATEAPRGLLYHRYRLEDDGTIAEAQIVPPTSQNQATIEEDLVSFIGGFLDLPEDDLRHRCEQTVRNYDPCISCATHFLKLDLDRG
jgi:coenzyme F420-reducing hydrogenase alpha subunit